MTQYTDLNKRVGIRYFSNVARFTVHAQLQLHSRTQEKLRLSAQCTIQLCAGRLQRISPKSENKC